MSKGNIEGIVVKVTENTIVLMCANGTFRNVPRISENNMPLLGERYIHIEKKKIDYRFIKFGILASLFFLAIVTYAIFPVGLNNSTYIVAIDINPSIELVVNEKMEVIEATANNIDGEELISSIALNQTSLADAFDKIILYSVNKGIFNNGEKIVAASVIGENQGKQSVLKEVKEAVKTSLVQHHVEVESNIKEESISFYEEAKSLNISVNQYSEFKKLENEGQKITIEELKGKTIAELKKYKSNNQVETEGQTDVTEKDINKKHSNNQQNNIQNNQQNKDGNPVNEKEQNKSATNKEEKTTQEKSSSQKNERIGQQKNEEKKKEVEKEVPSSKGSPNIQDVDSMNSSNKNATKSNGFNNKDQNNTKSEDNNTDNGVKGLNTETNQPAKAIEKKIN